MSYKANYTDESGHVREVSITEEDSIEALKNDYEEIKRRYNPAYVLIRRVQAESGEAMHLRVSVLAPSHYLVSKDDSAPKPCDSMTADIVCYPGYPLRAVSAYYNENRYLASPNVFRSGSACIDAWIPFKSSLITVVDKLVHDMIHDPNVTRYDSMANSSVSKWHMDGVAAKNFPTIQPKLLYAPEVPALPPRRASGKPAVTPPALPRRNR